MVIADTAYTPMHMAAGEQGFYDLFLRSREGMCLSEIIRDNRGKPRDFRVIAINPAFAQMFHAFPEHAKGRNFRDLIPNLKPELMDAFLHAAETGERLEFEQYVAVFDTWLDVCVFRKGKDQMVGLIFNITSLKHVELDAQQGREALEHSQALLQAIVNNIPDLIYAKDNVGHLLLANPAMLNELGRPADGILGKTDLQLCEDTDIGRAIMEDDRRVMSSGQPQTSEEVRQTLKGKRTFVSTKAPYSDDDDVLGIVGISRDITDQKNYETNLQDHATQLESAIKELDAFAYSVSHDLRAPLRSIDGFSQALIEDYQGQLDDQGKDYLHRIRESAEKMSKQIDAILRLSRQTRRELRKEHFNLTEVATQILEGLANNQPSRKVIWIVAKGCTVTGDPEMLTIALDNLIRNAWKFTSHQPKSRIEVGCERKDTHLTFFVRDNGVGFDMRYVDKLFIPYQRLHSEKEYPGIGIGLATVKRIIEKHHGRIWAKGEPGKGATFYFTLPLSEWSS
jgi:PAS domain S-box-containing protein